MPVARLFLAILLWLLLGWHGGLFSPAAVLVFVLASYIATSQIGEKLAQSLGAEKFDPRDWHYDENTGECHWIMIANKEGFVWDATPYNEKVKNRVILRNEIFMHQSVCLVLGVFSIFWCMAMLENPSVEGRALFVSMVVYCLALISSVESQCKFYNIHLGPAPGQPSNRLIEQKAHGEGRWLTPEEASMAGGGAHAAASIDDYRFPD